MALHHYMSERFPGVEWKPRKQPTNIRYKLATDILLLVAGAGINEGVKFLSKEVRAWLNKQKDVKKVEILDPDGNVLRTVRRSQRK